jgi:hypothetical protein
MSYASPGAAARAVTVDHVEPVEEVFANRFSLDEDGESWLLAGATYAHVDLEDLGVPARRSNSPSLPARGRILGWVPGRIAPSSRKSVAPSASSKRPSFRPTLP